MTQPSISRLAGWGGQGIWAVLDQAAFAGSNFIVNIMLARLLSPTDYGAYAAVYAIFLLVGTLHTSLFTEPGSVLGISRYSESFDKYINVLLIEHIRFSLIMSFIAIVIAALLQSIGSSLAATIYGISIAAPLILLQWMTRRLAYVGASAKIAAESGIFYAATVVFLLLLLYLANFISPFTALVSIGVASLLASLWILRKMPSMSPSKILVASDVRAQHWKYGKWALVSNFLSWLPGNIFFPLFVAFNMAEEGARLRVLHTLILPVSQFNGALATLLLPKLTRVRGDKKFNSYLRMALGGLLGSAILNSIIIGLWGNQFAQIVVGENYIFDSLVLWMAGLVPVAAALSAVYTAVLRAVEQPRLITHWYILIAVLTLLAMTTIAYNWGSTGALIWSVVSTTILGLGSFFSWQRLRGKISA